MSKTRRDRRGNTADQALRLENDKLKRQIAQLRKALARVDLDRYTNLRDIIQQHYRLEDAERHAEKERESLEQMQREWHCNTCDNGHLEIILINKRSELGYYRKCTNCTHRTPLKKYNKNVRGIVKKDS